MYFSHLKVVGREEIKYLCQNTQNLLPHYQCSLTGFSSTCSFISNNLDLNNTPMLSCGITKDLAYYCDHYKNLLIVYNFLTEEITKSKVASKGFTVIYQNIPVFLKKNSVVYARRPYFRVPDYEVQSINGLNPAYLIPDPLDDSRFFAFFSGGLISVERRHIFLVQTIIENITDFDCSRNYFAYVQDGICFVKDRSMGNARIIYQTDLEDVDKIYVDDCSLWLYSLGNIIIRVDLENEKFNRITYLVENIWKSNGIIIQNKKNEIIYNDINYGILIDVKCCVTDGKKIIVFKAKDVQIIEIIKTLKVSKKALSAASDLHLSVSKITEVLRSSFENGFSITSSLGLVDTIINTLPKNGIEMAQKQTNEQLKPQSYLYHLASQKSYDKAFTMASETRFEVFSDFCEHKLDSSVNYLSETTIIHIMPQLIRLLREKPYACADSVKKALLSIGSPGALKEMRLHGPALLSAVAEAMKDAKPEVPWYQSLRMIAHIAISFSSD